MCYNVVKFCNERQDQEHTCNMAVRRQVTQFFHLVNVEDIDSIQNGTTTRYMEFAPCIQWHL